MTQQKKRGRGKPSKYDTHVKPYLSKIKEWSAAGATKEQIAKALGIAVSTFCVHQNKYEELQEALKIGRDVLVLELQGALAKRAKGFEYEEKKTYIKKDIDTGETTQYTEVTKKQALPDVAAINLSLKNYNKDNWSNDPQLLAVRKAELELRKEIEKNKDW